MDMYSESGTESFIGVNVVHARGRPRCPQRVPARPRRWRSLKIPDVGAIVRGAKPGSPRHGCSSRTMLLNTAQWSIGQARRRSSQGAARDESSVGASCTRTGSSSSTKMKLNENEGNVRRAATPWRAGMDWWHVSIWGKERMGETGRRESGGEKGERVGEEGGRARKAGERKQEGG